MQEFTWYLPGTNLTHLSDLSRVVLAIFSQLADAPLRAGCEDVGIGW